MINRGFALVVLIISALTFFSTVQPSVSFWDCGEFIASSYYLQVPHPPGTPFFLMIGRIFSLIPFADNIAFRVNTISVLSSVFSVFFLYLIIVKLIENYRGKEPKNMFDAVATYLSAAVGALSLAFSDTFWFNAVEAEVYALSTFLFAAITYLMMRWNERADTQDNEKYILLIAYLIGLSTAVHLMSVLAVLAVVMIIIFRKYLDDEENLKKTAYILLGHVGFTLIIAFALWGGQKSQEPPSPEDYQAFDTRFKMIVAGLSALIMGGFWKKIFNRNSFYFPLMIGGIALFVTYPGIVKMLPGFMTSIAGDNVTTEIFLLLIILGALGYGVYYSIKKNKPTLHMVFLSTIFILFGFTTYVLVIVRANQDPPMNENQPDSFTELVSYLNREQYGDFPTFKRRFATEPHQMGVYTNYTSDLDFWWRYQMNHMMTRYWLWNYAGRESWYQDSGVNIAPLNKLGNAIFKPLGISFGGETKDSLFGIPLLLGLIGIYFHFKKDWKMAAIFMTLFVFMGYLTAFYQNQQQPQPRERDYFYVGAFFVFSIWIGIAMRGLVDAVQNKIKEGMSQQLAVGGVLLLGFIFVPVRMFSANYFTHDRSQNWVPWDYSYNLLQSCAPNAILFTNGDNDTFPLWYLQDVEGVRRDIRIANLSLLNTPWYIKQLRDLEPYGAPSVKMRFNHAQIDQLRPIQWEGLDITLPVPKNIFDQLRPTQWEGRDFSLAALEGVFEKYGVNDSAIINSGSVTFRMNNTVQYGNVKAVRVQDLMVREIVEANAWERPIYFAVTCSDDSKIGLSDYLLMEGMAMRLVPQKRAAGVEFINEPVLYKQVYEENPGYSKDYQPGFKFRGLNNPEIFFDENHERLMQNYRNAFIRLALFYISEEQANAKVIATLDKMEEKIPRKLLPIDYRLLFDIGNLYNNAGAKKQYEEIAREVETQALKAIESNPSDVSSYYNPYRILLETYDNLREYNKAIEMLNKLLVLRPGDSGISNLIEQYKLKAKMQTADTLDK